MYNSALDGSRASGRETVFFQSRRLLIRSASMVDPEPNNPILKPPKPNGNPQIRSNRQKSAKHVKHSKIMPRRSNNRDAALLGSRPKRSSNIHRNNKTIKNDKYMSFLFLSSLLLSHLHYFMRLD